MKTIIRIMVVMFISASAFGQTDFEKELEQLSQTQPGLNAQVQVNVTGITLADFINAIALENNLNVSVDDELKKVVVNNFYDARVKDVFVFLVKKYDLQVEIIGSIISFSEKPPIKEESIVYVPKKIKVEYKPENQFLSVDLKRDSLYRVAEEITRKSDKNVILAPDIKDKLVSVYIENRPFDQTIEMIAKSNGLKVTSDENGFYYLELADKPVKNNQGNNQNNVNRPNGNNPDIYIEPSTSDNRKINVIATNAPIKDIIEMASTQLGEHYFMYDIPEGNSTLKVKDVTFDELLAHIMNGTEYTFKKADKYYLIGDRSGEGLRATEMIQLENRTIETVESMIPSELLKGIEYKPFLELNGLIVSGSYLRIAELKEFMKSLDQVVPMVQIDIIIVQSKKTSTVSTGMKAGISQDPVTTNGDIFPAVDMTLNSETINGLLQAFNGFGIINLGAVTPNFYLSLKALESNSVIDIESTPQIATLNSHEATFTVGETNYYQQETVNVTPNISGGSVISNRQWTATDANLSITVTPFVSADEYVTLDIKVEQNDFAGKEDPTAPPNKQTQSFNSLIRVKNGEMILMGGLERKSSSNSGSGTPFLSRVPVLKWFFSSREKAKEKSKLHVFIKPTVTY
ncbi:MAG: type II and III secretion system protein [Crocinitomicaceae bacterium]|nr:type II and III secretion system protein [Crocinitomicaceae bacterium]